MQASTLNNRFLLKGAHEGTTAKSGLPGKCMPMKRADDMPFGPAPPPPAGEPCAWTLGAVPCPPPPRQSHAAWVAQGSPPTRTGTPIKAPPAEKPKMKAPPAEMPTMKAPPPARHADSPRTAVITMKEKEVAFIETYVQDGEWVKVRAVEAEATDCKTTAAEKKRLLQVGKRARKHQAKLEVAEVVATKLSRVESSSAGGASSGIFRAGVEGVTAGIDKMGLILQEGGSDGGSTGIPASDLFRGSSAGRSDAGGTASACMDAVDEESGGEDGGADGGGRSLKGKLECSTCGADCPRRSDFLLCAGGPGGCGAAWQGKLWGICQVCSEMPLKLFLKKSKREWMLRANAVRERAQDVRCVNFTNLMDRLGRQLPGAKNTLLRHLANSRIRCATLAFASSIAGESKEMLLLRQSIDAQHKEDCEAAVRDPANCVTPEGHMLSTTESGYLTTVAAGITVSFACRYRHCMWFGQNHEWPKHLGSEHFRCPVCGLLYQPTAGIGEKRAPYSFVLSLPDVETGEQINVPAAWPDDVDHKWLMKSIEAYAVAPSTAAELESYTLKTVKIELHDLLQRVKVPSHFTHQPWVENKMVAWPAADYDWSLYRSRGTTFGCKLDPVRDSEAIEKPFTQWPLLIALVGRVVAMTRSGNNLGAQACARAMPQ